MIVEVVNTGTELLLGEILNTNFQYLSRQLNKLGYDVLYQTTVGDNETRLRSVLENHVRYLANHGLRLKNQLSTVGVFLLSKIFLKIR